jgi:hypothetical protein
MLSDTTPFAFGGLGGFNASRAAAPEQCDFRGIFHRYITMDDSSKLAC